MLLAIALLLFALTAVLVKDRDIWFGSSEPTAYDADADTSADVSSPAARSKTPSLPLAQPSRKHLTAPDKEDAGAAPAIIANNRTALPPLEIEVVAGDSRRNVRPNNAPSVKVEMSPRAAGGNLAAAAASAPATNAAERVKISADTAQVVDRPVNPSYPMLAKQMKVQGSVVLQALIGVDGMIQDLRVLSGPSILSSAAREAVKQWHFKPYLQNGQAVETEAKITVNFTISTM
ncbi:MAG TPA: energy transducer TonB [Terriglobales bacterium]